MGTEDSLDSFLNDLEDDLEEYYPGSKTKVGTKPKGFVQEEIVEEDEDFEIPWDVPKYKRWYQLEENGPDVEFFTMGGLAAALGRRAVTMRLWESKGVLPTPTYRTPAGGAIAGKRLYTREQVEGIRKIAEEEGLLYSTKPPSRTNFTKRALELFQTGLRTGE